MEQERRKFEVKNPKLDRYHILLHEALFHSANGYIGVRYDFEEGYPEPGSYTRSQYINGFYELSTLKQPENLYGLTRQKETMLNLADTQTIRLFLEDEEFSMFLGTVQDSSLTLDMDRGIMVRRVLWRSEKGKELRLTVTRMASFHQLSLFTIEYQVEPVNFSGEIRFESGHDVDVMNYFDPNDPRTADEAIQKMTPVSSEIKDGVSYITCITAGSQLEVCSGVANILSQEGERQFSVAETSVMCKYKTFAEQGSVITLTKCCVFCDSIRHDDCKASAAEEMRQAVLLPMSVHYRRQADYLENYWKFCHTEIEGDERSNAALQYNLYQLIQSVGKDRNCNIPPKGLSGDGYEGQYFWDSEIYVHPFFAVTNPEISKKLIEYRYYTLDKARENARILGHQTGALYPWRTISGRECSGDFPAGSAQYHINGDVAYAVIAYYLATKDRQMMVQMGAEMIFETARVWMGTGHFFKGKFHINDVTGPDEYTCIVNNNYYTNALAQHHLHWAVRIFRTMGNDPKVAAMIERIGFKSEEVDLFEKASQRMYLPYDKELKINPQDDAFMKKKPWDIKTIPCDRFPLLLHYHPLHLYRHRVCKQADTVLAYFLLEDIQSEEVMRNSYTYYETITTHDSSLSRSIFSIMAARLGWEDKALFYFGNSIRFDMEDQCKNTKDGIHIANMAGNYLMIVYGFGGFRLKESGISFAPMLPKKWQAFSFKIHFEDSRIFVRVEEEKCIFVLESGTPKSFLVYGREYLLENRLEIPKNVSD